MLTKKELAAKKLSADLFNAIRELAEKNWGIHGEKRNTFACGYMESFLANLMRNHPTIVKTINARFESLKKKG